MALIERYNFPRHKVCGDGIPGVAIKALKQLNPDYIDEIEDNCPNILVKSTRFASVSGKEGELKWVLKAFNCQRYYFDAALLDLVKKHTSTQLFLDTQLKSVNIHKKENNKDYATVTTNKGEFSAKLIVACDGTHSVVGRQLAGHSTKDKHFSMAVRAYYSDIGDCVEGRNEVFFSKKYFPGYLWIFQVAPNLYNVGFGMEAKKIAKHKINLSQTMLSIIDSSTELKERFQRAKQVSEIVGMGLPMRVRRNKVSGNCFLLCGDAASLINPISGEGISAAFVSGVLAAKHIIKHKEAEVFSAKMNQEYDAGIHKHLGKELRGTYFKLS